MNREYLQSFTEAQLDNYQNTLKRRVADLKHLTLSLGMQNVELATRYQSLIQKKKQLSNTLENSKKSWNSWIAKGKEKITGLLHIKQGVQSIQSPAKQQHKQIAQNQIENTSTNQSGYIQVQQQNLLQPLSAENKDITVNNFNFDDLYHIGKAKINDFIGKGSNQIRHIKEVFIDKYRIKDDKVQNVNNNSHLIAQQVNHQKQLSPQITKEKDNTIFEQPTNSQCKHTAI